MSPQLDITAYPGNIINNEFVPTTATRHSINPSTKEALYEVPVSTQADVDLAVKHARKAFESWAKVPFAERAKLLLDFADAIEAHREPLEKLLVLEQGKPLGLAKTELDMSLQWLRAFSTMEVKDEVLDDNEERTITQIFSPLGVCCGIVPWNWPVLLGLGKVGPALITGNTIIIKPSPFTPYCDLKLGEIGMAIFPPGVLQVLSGGDDLGPMLTEHPDIDKVTFTGSSETGKLVMQSCAKTLKRVTLELGGNDAAIICEDVDIPAIIPKIATLAFLNSGQICMLIKRLYVHENIYAEFRAALVAFSKGIMTGDGFTPDVLVGPVQNAMQYEKVKNLYSEIKKCNWTQALEGEVMQNSKGFFITPAIIDNPPDDSHIVVEEPFGPILPILKWSDEDDVLRRANDTKAGLGASVWSKDLDRAERMARCLSAGSVWINSHFDVAPNVPFGGHKWSGIGREWGMMGLKSYCNSTSLWKWKKAM
ncbi:Aldehyde/histidinol dehydrogenase [Aspergillus insuetus]